MAVAGPAPLQLAVIGSKCTIFRDDEAAAEIDQEKHLVTLNDKDVTVDKYDWRLQVENLALYVRKKRKGEEADSDYDMVSEEEAMLDAARFSDLNAAVSSGTPDDEVIAKAAAAADEAYLSTRPALQQLRSLQHVIDSARNEGEALPDEKTLLRMIGTAEFVQANRRVYGAEMVTNELRAFPELAFMAPDHPHYHIYSALLREVARLAVLRERQQRARNLARGVPNTSPRTLQDATLVINITPKTPEAPKSSSEAPPNAALSSILQAYGTADETEAAKKPRPDIPGSEEQALIDKLAQLVAKNGEAFLDKVKERHTGRFQFINPGHRWYDFFQRQVDIHRSTLSRRAGAASASSSGGKTITMSLKRDREDRAGRPRLGLGLGDDSSSSSSSSDGDDRKRK